MAKRGPKTALTDKHLLKIRVWVLEGRSIQEIADLSGVKLKTVEAWRGRNYNGFADKMREYRRERMLAKAEGNIADILDTPIDKETMRPVADMSKFVAETLGSKIYSKKTEVENTQVGALLNIESLIVNIANGERKSIQSAGARSDPSASVKPVQEREGRTIDLDEDSVHSIRSNIQEILSKSESDGAHEVREEPSGSPSSTDESSDVS